MANTIEITPSDKGRLIVRLYGEDYDVTELADKNGEGTFKAFGQEYSFTTAGKKKSTRKTTKQPEPEPEPEEPESEPEADDVTPEETEDEA